MATTRIFACVCKITAAIRGGEVFEDPAMCFEGAVVTSCGQANSGEETCTELGRWSLQSMLFFVEEIWL